MTNIYLNLQQQYLFYIWNLYKKDINFFGFHKASLEYLKTEYSYDWISPVEDIDSPFILGLSINGVTLENAINESISMLPQRNKWSSHQLKLSSLIHSKK